MIKVSTSRKYCLPKHLNRRCGKEFRLFLACFVHSFSSFCPNCFDSYDGSTSYMSVSVSSFLYPFRKSLAV